MPIDIRMTLKQVRKFGNRICLQSLANMTWKLCKYCNIYGTACGGLGQSPGASSWLCSPSAVSLTFRLVSESKERQKRVGKARLRACRTCLLTTGLNKHICISQLVGCPKIVFFFFTIKKGIPQAKYLLSLLVLPFPITALCCLSLLLLPTPPPAFFLFFFSELEMWNPLKHVVSRCCLQELCSWLPALLWAGGRAQGAHSPPACPPSPPESSMEAAPDWHTNLLAH